MTMDGVYLEGSDGPLIVKVAEIGFTANKKNSAKKPAHKSPGHLKDVSCNPGFNYEPYGASGTVYSFVEPNPSFSHYGSLTSSMRPMITHGVYSPSLQHVPLSPMSVDTHQAFCYKEIITVKVTNLPAEIVDAGFLMEMLSLYNSNFISANIEDSPRNSHRIGLIYIEGMQHAQHIASLLNGAVLLEGATPLNVCMYLQGDGP